MAHYRKTSVLALALTLGCEAALAAQDSGFVDSASAANVAEIQAGQLAQDKAVAKDVKDFATLMVKDHTTSNDKLKAIAQSKRMEVSADPDAMSKIKTMILDMRSAKAFDGAYAENQVSAHEAAIKLFQEEASSGKDPDLKAFATATLPKLQEHLSHAKALAAAHAKD